MRRRVMEVGEGGLFDDGSRVDDESMVFLVGVGAAVGRRCVFRSGCHGGVGHDKRRDSCLLFDYYAVFFVVMVVSSHKKIERDDQFDWWR